VTIRLGDNSYGKSEVRLVRVSRDGDRHELVDLNVSVALAGDLEATHLTGDNSAVLPTDTQKNTVYAFARSHGVGEPEEFGLALAHHFVKGRHGVESQPTISWAEINIEEYGWERLGPHSFRRVGAEVRTATVTYDGGRARVESGLTGLVLMNTTGSEFKGFVVDEYTTLAEADDRILATAVNAHWRHATDDSDWAESYAVVRSLLVEAFVETYSASLQQTLYAMGSHVLEHRPEIDQVSLALPNRHHFLVDLSPFGLDNPGEVFFPADRPYGLIEATVVRE
jgi:urate oxidase